MVMRRLSEEAYGRTRRFYINFFFIGTRIEQIRNSVVESILKVVRPGRDSNPGQKLRRLLGYPLPYRGTIVPYIVTIVVI
jgi:hypothetical protein